MHHLSLSVDILSHPLVHSSGLALDFEHSMKGYILKLSLANIAEDILSTEALKICTRLCVGPALNELTS